MKRMAIIACLLIALLSSCAQAQTIYWTDAAQQTACAENRTGCSLLQMVMTGSFSQYDREDSLSRRVFSAVLPMLLDITPEDAAHFAKEHGAAEEDLQRAYYIALGHCLWASLQSGEGQEEPAQEAANLLLSLFLDPASVADGAEMTQAMRRQMDEEDIRGIAEAAKLPFDFVNYLMTEPDWRSAQK